MLIAEEIFRFGTKSVCHQSRMNIYCKEHYWSIGDMQESDFREVADEFINLANDLSEEWAKPFLSASFMYAAAWYNTHFFFESDGSAESQEAAIDYYCDQYKKMLQECMHDFSKS